MNMNVFQVATTAGVKLVLFASSVQVTAGAPADGPLAPYLPLQSLMRKSSDQSPHSIPVTAVPVPAPGGTQ